MQEMPPAIRNMDEAAVSVPSFSARLRENAIVEPQNRIAKMPWIVERFLSFTEDASRAAERFALHI